MHGMKIQEVVDALERFAPLPLQEDYDNAGLQLGLTEAQEVSGALLCLDVTEAIVDEAIAKGCNLIVSHHPLIFRPLKHITGENYVQQTVMKAIRNNVAIVSMHTNLDNAEMGVNHKIAEKMGLTDIEGGGLTFGTFNRPISARDFITMIKDTFDAHCVMTNGLLSRPIRKVAMCGGAGSFYLDEAIKAGADAFVTGEMHYHEYFGHEQEIQIAVMGHYESEHFTNEIFKEIIERECAGVMCHIAETNTNPIVYC